MKKVASLVAAGALLLSTATEVFAYKVHQWTRVTSTTYSSVSTGSNYQNGSGSQRMNTSYNESHARSATGGNANLSKSNGVRQEVIATSTTYSSVSTGSNYQRTSKKDKGSQQIITGDNLSTAGSLTVGNVSASFR